VGWAAVRALPGPAPEAAGLRLPCAVDGQAFRLQGVNSHTRLDKLTLSIRPKKAPLMLQPVVFMADTAYDGMESDV
jgi:hypothetical protein